MKAAKVVHLVLTLFVVGPIWYYLMYKILQSVEASELMWFLFWIYVPIGVITSILRVITEKIEDD